MKEYTPQKQEFKTSGETFKELEKVLSNKEMRMEEIKANSWKKNKGKFLKKRVNIGMDVKVIPIVKTGIF